MDNFGQGSRPQRQMYDVSSLGLKCAECETSIKELPFEPKQDRAVYCRECNRARQRSRGPRY
jgi:CxxC-x17-CxxC domain-containing protein